MNYSLIAIATILSLALAACRAKPSFGSNVKSGYRAYANGNFGKARQVLTVAAAKLEKRNNLKYASTLLLLGNLDLKEKKYKQAEGNFKIAASRFSNIFGIDHYLTAEAFYGLARSLKGQGNSAESGIYQKKAQACFAKSPRAYLPAEIKAISKGKRDPFYAKELDCEGISILASAQTADEAMIKSADVIWMLTRRPDIRQKLLENKAGVSVIATSELTTDIPEYRHLRGTKTFDGRDYDTATRGQGGTLEIPVTTAAEENILLLPWDIYLGQNILLHEFAHAIFALGLSDVDRGRIKEAYDKAMKEGLWKNTYAASNFSEYFAEATGSFFNSNQREEKNVHNQINTRKELKKYDPRIYEILENIYIPESQGSNHMVFSL